MPFSVWARGDSSTANNASLNAQGTSTTPTTLLTFEAAGPDGDEIIEFNKGAGTIDDDTVVYVGSDPTPYTFVAEFGGYLPQTNKLSNVNGVDLRGAEILVLTVQETGQRYFFLVGSDGTTYYYNIMQAFPNGAHSISGVFACYAEGTQIATPDGPRPVEALVAGDLVLTADGRAVPVRLTVARALTRNQMMAFPALHPFTIPAGAFGPGLPSADLTVSALHRILVRDATLQLYFALDAAYVMARDLPQAHPTPVQDLTYVHLLCDDHEVLIANGIESESLFAGDVALAALGPRMRDRVAAEVGDRHRRTAYPCLTSKEAQAWAAARERRRPAA